MSRSAIPRPRRHSWHTARITTARYLVAAALAATTATLVLVLDEALPARDQQPRLGAARGVALAVALVWLLLAIRWWVGTGRPRGTVVHVQLRDESVALDDSTRGRHVGLLRQARRRGLAQTSVTRWVNLTPPADGEPIDLVRACADLAATLEVTINSDQGESRRLIASDMPWPAALGVGAQLPVTAHLRLLELSGWPEGTGPQAAEAVFALPWSLPRSLDSLTVERSALSESSTTGRVGLIVALTKSVRYLDPTQVFAGCGVSEYHLIQPTRAEPGAEEEAAARTFTGKQLAALARRLPMAISEVKQRCGGRDLVVAAAVPSGLAMAVGWGLAHTARPFFAGTHLLHYDDGSNGYAPVRVHPSQPVDAPHAPPRR